MGNAEVGNKGFIQAEKLLDTLAVNHFTKRLQRAASAA